jgi:hypothetical membrane protein
MTQLVRSVHAPSWIAGDGDATGSASASAELTQLPATPVRRSTYSAASAPGVTAPVPAWTVASAALCPILLVGGWLAGGALQTTSYNPMQQTMSVLAGQPGTHPWIMTGALVLVGTTQLVTAAGLRQVGVPARVLLVVTGLCTFGVASSPEPTAGPSPLHLAFATSCVFTTAIWPIFVARRPPAPSWAVSSYGCAAVTAFFAVLSAWVLFASLGGGDLGLAERVTSTALGLFPLVVALGLRQAPSSQSRAKQPISRRGLPAEFQDARSPSS